MSETKRPHIDADVAMAILKATNNSANRLYGASYLPKPPDTKFLSMPRPAPGVLPTGPKGGLLQISKDRLAADSAFSAQYYQNAGAYGAYGFAGGQGWLGYSYLAELTIRPEFRRISEVKARDMTRKWLRFKAKSEDTNKAERIQQLEEAFKKYKIRDLFRWAAEYDGFMGRAQIYIDCCDPDDRDELKTPLNIEGKLSKGQLRGFKKIEPLWSYPAFYNSWDPLKDDYFKPTTWFVMSKEVHASRLLTFVGREMPDLLKPAYQFGGLSLSQMALPYVDNFIRTRQSISNLIHSYSVMVLMTNMSSILQEGASGAGSLIERINLFTQLRDNSNTFAIDKATEDFKNVAAPLAGLHELQSQSQEQICSVSGEPLVVYTGITPSGLNASSDGEIRVWYQTCHAEQESLFTPNMDRVMEVVQIDLWGEIDEDIVYEWVPLWQLDEAGEAAVRKTDADAAAVLIENGVIDAREERKRLATAPSSNYPGLDVDDVPEPPEEDDGKVGTGGGETHTDRKEDTALDAALAHPAIAEIFDMLATVDRTRRANGRNPL